MKTFLLLAALIAFPAGAFALSPAAAEGICALAVRGSLIKARTGNMTLGETEAMMFCINSGALKANEVAAAAADFNAVAKPLD